MDHRLECLNWLSDDLTDLLSGERAFFLDATNRLDRVSEQQKLLWRAETVFQRRHRLSDEVYEAFDGVVQHGPFEGTKLTRSKWRGMPDFASMLLGFYELEVLNLIVDILQSGADYFVDIGAAEGYYPVGAVRSGLTPQAYAFESDSRGRSSIRENMSLNQITHAVQVLEEANKESIDRIVSIERESSGLFLCDIAGGEFDLFTPELWATLKGHHVILEVHNWVPGFNDGYPQLLAGALPYFEIASIAPAPRPIWSMPELDGFTDDNRLLICSEGRPNKMRFLYFRPKGGFEMTVRKS